MPVKGRMTPKLILDPGARKEISTWSRPRTKVRDVANPTHSYELVVEMPVLRMRCRCASYAMNFSPTRCFISSTNSLLDWRGTKSMKRRSDVGVAAEGTATASCVQ